MTNPNFERTDQGSYMEIVKQVESICMECFSSPIGVTPSLEPVDITIGSYKICGFRELPAIFIEFKGMQCDGEQLGGLGGVTQTLIEGIYIDVHYALSDVDKIESYAKLLNVGSKLTNILQENMNLNSTVNGPKAKVLASFPDNDIVWQDKRIKPVDLWTIQLYYEKTKTVKIVPERPRRAR